MLKKLDWPKPDLSILNASPIPAPSLPIEVLGPWADWIAVAAEAKEAPVDFATAPFLSAVAGLIGNTRTIEPRPDWSELSNR
jgi:hypothetical protein